MKHTVALYLRVSTKDQNTDLQRRDLERYAEIRGWTDMRVYEDLGHSGAKKSRPALDRLMDDARRRRIKTIVVWRFDRFARSASHLITALEEFKSLGIDFVSFTENVDTSSPLGQALFTIIGAMAQLERDIIRERVVSGLKTARAKGIRLGRPKALRDDDRIATLRDGGASIRAIASELKITASAVQRSLGLSLARQKISG